MRRNIFALVFLLCFVGLCAYLNQNRDTQIVTNDSVIKIEGPIFGTFYGITVVGDYPGGGDALKQDAEKILNRINKEISTFDKSSDLYLFNEKQSTEPYPMSDDAAKMIMISMRVGRELFGVMDITVGPLVDLWGFGHVKKEEGYVPTPEEIAVAQKFVGQDKLHLIFNYDGVLLKKDLPEMRVDLATIGEGFAADELSRMLDEAGVKNYLVHVAGAMRTRGFNPSGAPWKIAIEQPRDLLGSPASYIDIHNRAVSTAGSYRNYFEKDGQRYSHAIDPRTGMPIRHNTVSVTVIGDSATYTDAMDTGLLVLGADEALKYADEHQVAIYCLIKTSEGFAARWSKAFEKYMIRQ
ncbi:MAG: FAD:protein FMN transferase [Succinivibrionaceae bacterium]